MAETEKTQTPESTETQVEKPNRLKAFVNKHPRATRVVGITAALATAAGVVAAMKSAKEDGYDQAIGDVVELAAIESETTEAPEAKEA